MIQSEVHTTGPHLMRVRGKSVKNDSSPVRGPRPMRVREQEKEIQGGMVGKQGVAVPRGLVAWRIATSDPLASATDDPAVSISQRIRCVARFARCMKRHYVPLPGLP